jgi:hypothetical protein
MPGDAINGIDASELANEDPVTPNPFIGLAAGSRTGPNLLVWTATGPAKILSASLTTADGTSLEVRWVDNTTANIGDYLTPGTRPGRPARRSRRRAPRSGSAAPPSAARASGR